MSNQIQSSGCRSGFLRAWDRLVGAWRPVVPTRRGRKARVAVTDLLPALAFHVMQGPGTLAEHSAELFPDALSDSAWADRRARLPWDIFADLMRRVLGPKATHRQRDAFWRGWRLVALDGTTFSLTNTPQISARVEKARTRRGRAAFAKLTTAVLLELGLHNPLAAGIGRHGESEWALAHRLLAQLPKRALLLGDRLYGVAAFLVHARAACARVGSHFLIRASGSTKPRLLKRLPDGTRLIAIAVRASAHNPTRIVDWLQMREIRVRVGRAGARTHELRLWTSLLDPKTAPALELARLYAQRWEHELYFRELKRVVRKTDVLQSHTVITGAQEIAALVLASAVLADERQRAAGALPVLRVSFSKLLERCIKPMWFYLDVAPDLLTEGQMAEIIRRSYARARRYLIPPRRARSCPRAVRQPLQAWPRLLHPESITGEMQFQLV
jgi:Transposase DDE domain